MLQSMGLQRAGHDWVTEQQQVSRRASQVAPGVKNPLASAGDSCSIPGLGRSPGAGTGNPLLHSFLENPMDRGAWRATVHGVAESWT